MITRKNKEFLRDDRGVAALFIALSLPVIIAAAAFAIDFGFLASVQAQLRTTADAAALAAATSIDDADRARELALEYAEKNMPEADNGTVVAETDVVIGRWSNSSKSFTPGGSPTNAVQVIARRSGANDNPVELIFGPFIGVPTLSAEATAIAAVLEVREDDTFCLLALDRRRRDAIEFSSVQAQLSNCGIRVNSDSSSALSLKGKSSLQVDGAVISVVGSIRLSGGADLDTDEPPVTGASRVSDPFRNLDVPSFSGCDFGPPTTLVTSDTTLAPGVYCGGLTINGNAEVDFNAGDYFIVDGDLRFEGRAQLDGEDVTFILTSTSTDGSTVGSLTVTGNSQLQFTAPRSGDLAGILFFQDRDAPSGSGDKNRITGNSELQADGSFYFPSQELVISGNSQLEVDLDNGCASIIARNITFTGGSQIQIDCESPGNAAARLPTGRKLTVLRN